MLKILFTNNSFNQTEIKKLADNNIQIIPADENLSEDQLIEALKDCDGYVIGGTDRATKRVIESANLKIIVFYGAGYQDYIDMESANAKSIIAANTPKANAYTVAEHTVAMILEGVKNITWLNNTTKQGNWFRKRAWNLQSKTLGIIGLGTIGTHVATIMKNAFNMNILYVNRSPRPNEETQLNAKKVSLEELLKTADIVSIHASLNDESNNMIDRELLSLMQKHAILVNVSRAKIVNSTALKEALEQEQIAKAVFDAYYEEPAPTKDNDKYGLLSLGDDKFVITPHTAYNTKEAFDNMNDMVIENLIAFSKGEPVPYTVN
jgi:phosphoglycerate dehydrogenase-like enzyme